jgi:hypothetical protein
MLHEPRSLDLALAAHDAQGLDAILSALASAPGLTPTRRRDLASAVRRVASAIGHTPETTAADPGWLRPRIRRVVPAAVGISAKTWTNVISDFRAALHIAGIRAIREKAEATGFPPAWATMHTALPCRRCRIGLARFMRFCANLGLDPAQVDDATLGAFCTSSLQRSSGKTLSSSRAMSLCTGPERRVLSQTGRRPVLQSSTGAIALPCRSAYLRRRFGPISMRICPRSPRPTLPIPTRRRIRLPCALSTADVASSCVLLPRWCEAGETRQRCSALMILSSLQPFARDCGH